MSALLIGLTGGIATGKSQVTAHLRSKGYQVVDADQVVHELQQPGGALFELLVNYLGSEILDQNGQLNRPHLAHLLFSKPDFRAWSDREQGRVIRQTLWKKVEQAKEIEGPVFFDIPLLFEAGYSDWFAEIWLVDVDLDQQIQRLMARNNLTKEQAQQRLASQWPLEKKRPLATRLIDNRGDQVALGQEVDRTLGELYQSLSKNK